MAITINNPSEESTLLEYIDRKNQVKGAIKSVKAQLIALQAKQADFGTFLAANPDYAIYYQSSVDAIAGLEADFNTLENLAQSWVDTVDNIESINPYF